MITTHNNVAASLSEPNRLEPSHALSHADKTRLDGDVRRALFQVHIIHTTDTHTALDVAEIQVTDRRITSITNQANTVVSCAVRQADTVHLNIIKHTTGGISISLLTQGLQQDTSSAGVQDTQPIKSDERGVRQLNAVADRIPFLPAHVQGEAVERGPGELTATGGEERHVRSRLIKRQLRDVTASALKPLTSQLVHIHMLDAELTGGNLDDLHLRIIDRGLQVRGDVTTSDFTKPTVSHIRGTRVTDQGHLRHRRSRRGVLLTTAPTPLRTTVLLTWYRIPRVVVLVLAALDPAKGVIGRVEESNVALFGLLQHLAQLVCGFQVVDSMDETQRGFRTVVIRGNRGISVIQVLGGFLLKRHENIGALQHLRLSIGAGVAHNKEALAELGLDVLVQLLVLGNQSGLSLGPAVDHLVEEDTLQVVGFLVLTNLRKHLISRARALDGAHIANTRDVLLLKLRCQVSEVRLHLVAEPAPGVDDDKPDNIQVAEDVVPLGTWLTLVSPPIGYRAPVALTRIEPPERGQLGLLRSRHRVVCHVLGDSLTYLSLTHGLGGGEFRHSGLQLLVNQTINIRCFRLLARWKRRQLVLDQAFQGLLINSGVRFRDPLNSGINFCFRLGKTLVDFRHRRSHVIHTG